MTRPKVFAIVCTYQSIETIDACLSSVLASDYPNLEVVVVDNSSTDGTLELVKEKFTRLHIIRNQKNVGFGAGNNVAIRFALERMADYIFLLNPDATIESDTLATLVATAEDNQPAGIFSPVIYQGDSKQIWFAGGMIRWNTMRAEHLFTFPCSPTPFATEYASGCAMLIRKEVFRDIGLFDQTFFLYYEDTDFCFRAGQKGYATLIVPNVSVSHFEASEGDQAGKTYWLVISALIFFQKHASLLWKCWHALYLAARKLKNKSDLRRNPTDPIALSVQRAYTDFKQWKQHR